MKGAIESEVSIIFKLLFYKMGSCVSCQVKPNTSINEDENNHDKCFICYQKTKCEIQLQCNHQVHAECLTKWWAKNPGNGLCCPLCRSKTYDCYMELTYPDKKPVGFYRQDSETEPVLIVRLQNYTGDSMFVKLPEIASRDMALSGFLFYFVNKHNCPAPSYHISPALVIP